MSLFEVPTKLLQKPDATLADARNYFDYLLERFPQCHHLLPNHQLIHTPDFENAIVKILNKEENTLTEDEKETVTCFRFNVIPVEDPEPAEGNDEPTPAEVMLVEMNAKKKLLLEERSEYIDLSWINPTSDIVEQFFSQVNFTYSDRRKSLLPENLEMIMFLKMNERFWDAELVAKALRSLEAASNVEQVEAESSGSEEE